MAAETISTSSSGDEVAPQAMVSSNGVKDISVRDGMVLRSDMHDFVTAL